MATLTRGQTFGSTETVTNTKLHNLVDLGSISNIVNADVDPSAAIVDTKLAQITTTNKVSGTAISNLASIPSGAGLLPFANIPVISSTYVSMVSIPNASLLPLTLASWVDGSAMRNIQSMPSLAGQLSWYSVVSSLASGSVPKFNGTTTFVGGKIVKDYTAGDYKIRENPTPVVSGITSTSYTKIAEIFLPRAGTLRIKFWNFGASTGQTGFGRIYRNGSAVGTERSTTTTTGIQYSEDISGWAAGDLLQLYAKTSNGADPAVIGGMELFEGAPETSIVDDVTYRTPKKYFGTGGPTLYTNLGAVGDTFINTNGGTSTTLYVKTAASTWTAK